MAKAKAPISAPSTYAEMQKQIAELQSKAEALKAQEVKDVIGRIREAIAVYGLTPDDLFGGSNKGKGKGKTKAVKVKAATGAQIPRVAKYKDPASDKTWTGVGKRPGWFVAAVESGVDPQTLAL
ncbi:MAG: nucleoid protein H-NS [Variovorax paradoxus]|nr:MAG: nucleoid protein H-NS [Variovorax paradoxus]PZQ09653.1 MAG: nucleoid protein H-NS [Variovorax paradoxus]